jgi:hypothetical protein
MPFANSHPKFKVSRFSVLNFCFVSNTPVSLNIVIKLNQKMRKRTKGILVILHPSIRIYRTGYLKRNKSSIHQSETLNFGGVFAKSAELQWG